MRVYLLLLAYIASGSGIIDIGDVRSLLTGKRSPWRVIGWRRLRQVLSAGDGVFWDRRTSDRLWLRSPDKIAWALDCGRFQGLPVAMEAKSLLGGIALVRAHFSTSYESGRRGDKPISQAALADITGVSVRSQYNYNQLLKRRTRKNIVVTGLPFTTENIQELSFKHNRPIFCFTDWKGKRGQSGAKTCAYQIADTRSSSHEQAPKGRIRKINRKIDLVTKPQRGNLRKVSRTIHRDAVAATKAFNSDPTIDRIWPEPTSLQPKATRRSKWQGVGVYGAITA
jgi:hypothetical protein